MLTIKLARGPRASDFLQHAGLQSEFRTMGTCDDARGFCQADAKEAPN